MKKLNVKMICVDFQKEFTQEKGKCFVPGNAVPFIKKTIIPYFKKKKIRMFEIVSDYRQPRKGDKRDLCHPGTFGYESEIPEEVKGKDVWIKTMNSPIWTRKNRGKVVKTPEEPYQSPDEFTEWLNKNIGKPENVDYIVLIGLSLECCVMCTAQQLTWLGYKVKILIEGSDPKNDKDGKYKKELIRKSPIQIWADFVKWDDVKKKF